MSAGTDLLVDAFGRIQEIVDDVLSGLGTDELSARLDEDANSIGWLVWHLTRVQDDHIADAAGTEQLWTAQGWYERFALPFADADTGFGHSPEDVAAVRDVSRQLLNGYHGAVHDNTVRFLKGLHVKDLDRVVDEGWAPPVTLGVRLVSVITDDLQHAGQAAFVRGVLRRG
ncbi:DinB family protein [Streptomyces sp. NPDC053427]|uniref:mycothiol transferase n=1 Tax=Streptomyces sp. NPDC053427 TaxID=3365701 RepID=UPI0037D23643